MAHEIRLSDQSMAEIRTWFVDFINDLPEGVTVSNAAVIHKPPAGGSVTTPGVVVATPRVMVTIGPLDITGEHFFTVLADLSNGDKSEVRLRIPVPW